MRRMGVYWYIVQGGPRIFLSLQVGFPTVFNYFCYTIAEYSPTCMKGPLVQKFLSEIGCFFYGFPILLVIGGIVSKPLGTRFDVFDVFITLVQGTFHI